MCISSKNIQAKRIFLLLILFIIYLFMYFQILFLKYSCHFFLPGLESLYLNEKGMEVSLCSPQITLSVIIPCYCPDYIKLEMKNRKEKVTHQFLMGAWYKIS